MQFRVRRIRGGFLLFTLAAVAAGVMTGCSHLERKDADTPTAAEALASALVPLKAKYAPDEHLGVYKVGFESLGRSLALTGEVDRAEARSETLAAAERTGLKVEDRLKVLPATELGEKTWGIACLSVASARELPEHKAEMGTQVLMGGVVRVLKPGTNSLWYYAQSADGYLAWLEKGTFVRCAREQVDQWNRGPLLIVTAFEDQILEQPNPEAQPVSDVVVADLVNKAGEQGDWYQVQLPDQRSGFLPKKSAEDFTVWKERRHATADNIERTARRFLGRPYLWGGNSPKGLDCSGFTKLVFYLNGIELSRNASFQVHQGTEVALDPDLSQLKKGDLLFFGRTRHGSSERVHHVGIYLGDKLFIHSSERVQINSLDPASPIRDELRIRTLLSARRVLTE
jgi:cell wall-associated NlpC family hydrolase